METKFKFVVLRHTLVEKFVLACHFFLRLTGFISTDSCLNLFLRISFTSMQQLQIQLAYGLVFYDFIEMIHLNLFPVKLSY